MTIVLIMIQCSLVANISKAKTETDRHILCIVMMGVRTRMISDDGDDDK